MKDEILENEKRWLLEEKYDSDESKKETAEYLSDIKKLESGYPLAYLIGNIEFLGGLIDLKHKPLIPRPETELWVNDIIQEYKEKPVKVLDLFSGSGCIGISILKNISNSEVDFGELNTKFVNQIKENIDLNNLNETNYNIYKTDVFSNIPDENKYDLILTNPPYIDKDKEHTVQDSVLKNEDYYSLFAEDEGVYFIKKIIDDGFSYLKDNGLIYIEYDTPQTEMIKNYLDKKGHTKYKFWKDQFGKDRVVISEK